MNTEKTQQFIKKAQNIHGTVYDYSRVVYKHSHKEVEIICPYRSFAGFTECFYLNQNIINYFEELKKGNISCQD